MVKVNLLPHDLGGVKKSSTVSGNLQKVPAFLLLIGFILLLVSIILWIESTYRKKNLETAIKEYKTAWELSVKIEDLKKEQKSLNSESSFLEGYLKRDFLWSEKLKQLSVLIPKEVWLKKLSLEKRQVKNAALNLFTLKGGLIPNENSTPLGTISLFVNRLKADKFFAADFENPVLSDFHSEVYKNTEITAFIIEMQLILKDKE